MGYLDNYVKTVDANNAYAKAVKKAKTYVSSSNNDLEEAHKIIYNAVVSNVDDDKIYKLASTLAKTGNSVDDILTFNSEQNTNKLENLETSFVEGLKSGGKGLITAVTGYTNTGWQAPSYEQYQLNQTRDDEKWTLYNIGLDATYGVGNMAPSLALWAINPVAGGITMFSSSAGEAYNQALYEGKSESEAKTYGIIIGAVNTLSEKTLGLLGNFKLAKSALGKVAGTSVAKSTIGRLTAAVGSEFTDEFMQQILQPVIQNVTLSGDEYTYKNNPINFEDALYNGVIGGITGGIFEGGKIVGKNAITSNIDKTIAKNIDKSASEVQASQSFVDAVKESAVANRVGVRITDGETRVDPSTKTLYLNKDFTGDINKTLTKYANDLNTYYSLDQDTMNSILNDETLTADEKLQKAVKILNSQNKTAYTAVTEQKLSGVQEKLNKNIELTGNQYIDKLNIDNYMRENLSSKYDYRIVDGEIIVSSKGTYNKNLDEMQVLAKQKDKTTQEYLGSLFNLYSKETESKLSERFSKKGRLNKETGKKENLTKEQIDDLTALYKDYILDLTKANYYKQGKSVKKQLRSTYLRNSNNIVNKDKITQIKARQLEQVDARVQDFAEFLITGQEKVSQDADKFEQIKKELIKEPQSFKGVPKVLTEIETIKKPIGQTVKETLADMQRLFTDSAEAVYKISKITNDDLVYALMNHVGQSSAMTDQMLGINDIFGTASQTDINGNVIGDNFNAIIEPIKTKGEQYFANFSNYVYLKNAIDQYANGKKTMGSLKATEISEMVDEYEINNPEFIDLAQPIYKYFRNLMQYAVDSGIINQTTSDYLFELYPNYVPIVRQKDATIVNLYGNKKIKINDVVGRLKGGNEDILPLDYAAGIKTKKIIREANTNLVLNRILTDAENMGGKIADKVAIADSDSIEITADDLDNPNFEPALLDGNVLRLYQNGNSVDLVVDKGTYDAFSVLKPKQSTLIDFLEAMRTRQVLNKMRELETTLSPIFMFRNLSRDIQDALVNTKYTKEFLKAYPKAVGGLAQKNAITRLYLHNGAVASSFIEAKTFRNKVLNKVEMANVFTEQMPRITEFSATLMNEMNVSYDELNTLAERGQIPFGMIQKAMYNAADITVNFARGGTFSKTYSRYVRRYFNAAIQGTSKFVRNFTETNGSKQWLNLIVKAAAFGIVPTILNSALNSDEDDWDEIPQEWKDQYYLFPMGDKQWVKIPKGRIASIFGMFGDRTVSQITKGEADWGSFFTTGNEQVGLPNPFQSTIASPIFDIINNKGWWGGQIETQAMQNYAPEDRYDAGTTSLSKWIGEQLGISPKKTDYILNSYSGVVGDVILPLLTPKAERGIIKSAFTLSSIDYNTANDIFYDTITQLTQDKNSGDTNAVMTLRYLNSQKKIVSDLYDQIKEVQSSNLSDDEKIAKEREIKTIINGVEQNAIGNLETFNAAVSKYYKGGTDSEVNYQYALINKEVFGSEYSLSQYNSDVYTASKTANTLGVDYDTYFDFYFATKDLTAQDEYGTTKTGLKKKQIVEYLNTLDIPYEQKLVLIKMKGYSLTASEDSVVTSTINDIGDMSYPEKLILYMDMGYKLNSPDEYKTIVDYVYSMDLTEDEKITMLKGYGFTFNNGSFYYN